MRLADRIAAGNLFLDRSKDRRRAEIDALHAQVGACRAGSGFDTVENALRGQWTMTCERGKLQVAVTLGADDAADRAVPGRASFAGDAAAHWRVRAVA